MTGGASPVDARERRAAELLRLLGAPDPITTAAAVRADGLPLTAARLIAAAPAAAPATDPAPEPPTPEGIDTLRRRLRVGFARLGTENARIVLGYYPFSDSADPPALRAERRAQLGRRFDRTPTALRRDALAIRAALAQAARNHLAGGSDDVTLPALPPADAAAGTAAEIPDPATARAWLLGTLPADAAERLCAAALADDAALEVVLDAEHDLHDDDVREQLSVAEHLAFRRQVLGRVSDADRRRAFSLAMRPAADSDAGTRRPAAGLRPERASPLRRFARSAAVGGVIAAGLAFVLIRYRPLDADPASAETAAAPTIAMAEPTLLLLGGPPAAARAPVAVAIAPNATGLKLQAEIGHREEARLYRLTVLADDGRVLFASEPLALETRAGFRFVEARVPAGPLLGAAAGGGTHRVRVVSLPPAGAFEDQWPLVVRRRDEPAIEIPSP